MNSPAERPVNGAEPTPASSEADKPAVEAPASSPRTQPIPAPSHAQQFRAIGLVRGRYAQLEKLNQGRLIVERDGEPSAEIDAVLLGRTISVVKNHVDLDTSHLWVVYPRTRQKEKTLQLQIVGIWEPETLKPETLPAVEAIAVGDDALEDLAESVAGEEEPAVENGRGNGEGAASAEDAEADKPKLIPPMPRPVMPEEEPAPPPPAVALPAGSGEFSVRGEVVFYSSESEKVVVKIKQSPRQDGDRPKFFKLEMLGKLPTNRALRQFWDLLVDLNAETGELHVRDAVSVAPIKPKKRAPNDRKPILRRNKKTIGPPVKRAGDGSDRPVLHQGEDSERPRPRRIVDRPRPQKRDG